MSDGISGKLSGLEPVMRKLRDLPEKVQRKMLRKAIGKGAAIVKRAAVDAAKQFDRPGEPSIYKELVVRTSKKLGQQNGGIAVQVGVRGGAKKYANTSKNRRQGRVGKSYEGGGNVYWWRFLEFGTQKMKARPFMGPALKNNAEAATAAIAAQLAADIARL